MNVYVIASEGGMCKIGKANDPAGRMTALSTGHPFKLTLAHVFPLNSDSEAYDIERRAHEALKGKRMQGEWFSVSADEARDVLAKLCPPPPLADLEDWHIGGLVDAMSALAKAQAHVADVLVRRKFDVSGFATARADAQLAIDHLAHVERNFDDDV